MNLFLSTFTPKVLKATGIFFLFYTSLCAQNHYYVNPSANGSGNGQSWADAFTELHQALSIAEAGDAVWVAKGDFRPDTATNRDRSFVLKSGVKLYGGFLGTETDLKQRNVAANPSLLNGNIGDPADSTDNSYTILYLPYPDTSTLVDGFTLQHGHANSDTNFISTSPVRSGGGVYVMAQGGKGMPTFSNCVFRDNYAKNFGGAYYVQAQGSSGSTPIFRNCIFFNNRAGGSGGAVHLSGGNGYDRGIEMDHCLFDMNRAHFDGGSVYWANAFGPENINFLGCTITRSKSTGYGKLIYAWRTGTNTVRIEFDSCHILQNFTDDAQYGRGTIEIVGNDNDRKGVIRVQNSKFENNDLTSRIFYINSSNDFYSTNPDSVFFLNNTFLQNKSGSSIRLEAPMLYAKIEGNVFAQNEQWDTIYPDEDIWIWGSNVDISKNIFYNNRSPSNVYIGLLARPNSYARIDNNVFSDNNRPLALTVRKFGTVKHDTAYVTNNVFVNNMTDNPVYNFIHPTYNVFTNNVFWGNKNSVTGLPILPFPMLKDTFYFAHNLFDASSYCTDYPYVACGPNNLVGLAPLFRDTANHDYSLLPCSPLLNKGSNLAASGILTDIAGNPRIQEGIVDIGAYESPAFALAEAPSVLPACASDSNGSISVSPVFGCEPYDYQWLPPAGDGPNLNGLPPGQYLLSITDASGRQILDTITVGQATAPSLSLASNDVQCGGQAGGSLLASVASGTAPFQYQWSPVAPDTAQLSKLPPGSYALTLTDANGCQDSAMASIALLGMLQPMIGGETISCNGAADGWLSLTPATGAAPFTWLWDGWPGMDSIAQPLGPGNYSVTVTDAFGCTASNTFPTMSDPAPITATVGTTDQTDLVMPNGAAVVTTVSGGTPSQPPAAPYAFSWSNGGMGQFIAGLMAGEYTVTVTDQNGCTASVTVEVDLMVGTEEAEGQALLIYPNPTADWVQVVLPVRQGLAGGPEKMGTARLELSDVSGRVLRLGELLAFAGASVGEASVGKMDLRGLPSGAYVLTLRDLVGKILFVGRVVKR